MTKNPLRDAATTSFAESGWTQEHGWESEMWESAFLAGAAWQRERDAKIAAEDGESCEGISTDWAKVSKRIAAAIRSGTWEKSEL